MELYRARITVPDPERTKGPVIGITVTQRMIGQMKGVRKIGAARGNIFLHHHFMIEGAGSGTEYGRSRRGPALVRHKADFVIGHFLLIAAQGEIIPESLPLLEALHGMPHQFRTVGKVIGAVRISPANFPFRIPGPRRLQRPRAIDINAGTGIGPFFKKGRVTLRAVHSFQVVAFPAEIADAGISLPPAILPVHGKSFSLVKVPVQSR